MVDENKMKPNLNKYFSKPEKNLLKIIKVKFKLPQKYRKPKIYEKYYGTRTDILDMLGNNCVRCGETDWRCLQIDHVNGGGRKEMKKNNLHYGNFYYSKIYTKVFNGSKDYQILCANCNWKKKYENNENAKKRK